MPIRRSPDGAHHPRPQAGRDRPEWVVAINRNAWSQSIEIGGRDHPVRACHPPSCVLLPCPRDRCGFLAAAGGNRLCQIGPEQKEGNILRGQPFGQLNLTRFGMVQGIRRRPRRGCGPWRRPGYWHGGVPLLCAAEMASPALGMLRPKKPAPSLVHAIRLIPPVLTLRRLGVRRSDAFLGRA
jgi:hypothetical protein